MKKLFIAMLMLAAQMAFAATDLTPQNYEAELTKSLDAGTPVVIEFYADWCGPCRMLTPVLEQVAKDMQGKVLVGKLDIDTNQRVAASYQVTSVPTMILFKDGKEVGRLVGLKDTDGVKKFINSAI